MDLKEKIEEIVLKNFTDEDLFIVDIGITGGENVKKISVLIDSDKTLNIATCAHISRKLGNELEELDIIATAYLLEVSSPGVDKPLKMLRQYVKNTGRKLAVTLHDGSIKEGVLESANEESIIIATEEADKANKKKINKVPVEIPFIQIKKSNIIVSFK